MLPGLPSSKKPKLLDRVRLAIRRKNYSDSTEQSYCYWIKRYILFHGKRHPDTMAEPEVEQFLSYLADSEKVSASTQNQAMSALLFLYRYVLEAPLSEAIQASRAKEYAHLPSVLSIAEVGSLLAKMTGTRRLMAELTYGAGLRLMEVHRLRVGHIDFAAKRLHILDSKGRKDRYTLLPEGLIKPIQSQIAAVASVHNDDLRQGLGSAVLPRAFHRKSWEASRQLRWQFLFPAKTTFHDNRTGNSGRWHANPKQLGVAVRKAAVAAGIQKRVTVHTLRHSFATHMLQDGCDVRTLQALLGHNNLNTTMIYAHINDNFCMSTPSPYDRHLLARSAET